MKRKTKLLLVVTIVGIIVGGIIGMVRYYSSGQLIPVIPSLFKGILLGGLLSLWLAFLEQIYLPERLRRFNFLMALLIRTVLYTLSVILVFMVISYAFSYWMPMEVQLVMLAPALIITFCIVFLSTFFISLNRLLGARVLFNFFSGRYHHPREEKRIFLFADLVSSTTIAEKIGHIQFHKFLRDFLHDVTEPILYSKGEIYKYVGDEVIVAWFLRDRRINFRCIECCFEMEKNLKRKESYYMETYGYMPEFRSGLHCGTVVAGEVGDSKREIAFLGDVVNTTARIQGEAKVKNRNILVSGDLINEMELPADAEVEDMGKIVLKGKLEEVGLFSVRMKQGS